MKNLLIITEIFPPMPFIGCHRWAKFAECFTRLDINLYVLTAPFIRKT
jgi:hypothetical protein